MAGQWCPDRIGALMPDLSAQTKDSLIDTAHALAGAARLATLRHFRRFDLSAETKETERFDPVTIADRESELRMREILAERRPDDAILGEEFGPKAGTSGLTWVLDPIDGTRGYLSGTPTWGVLISVADETGPIYGLIDQPYIQERFEGGFGVARVVGPMGEAPLKCRAPRDLSQAIVFSTFPEVGTPDECRAFARVSAGSPIPGGITDVAIDAGYGHLGRFAHYYRQVYGESPSETYRHYVPMRSRRVVLDR